MTIFCQIPLPFKSAQRKRGREAILVLTFDAPPPDEKIIRLKTHCGNVAINSINLQQKTG